MLWGAVGVALGAYLVLLFPVHLQNLLFYGDPISPFLERYKSGGDRLIIAFADSARLSLGAGFLPLPGEFNATSIPWGPYLRSGAGTLAVMGGAAGK